MSTQNCPKCFFLNPADAANCSRCGADLRTAAETGFFPEQVVGGRYRLVRRIGEGGMGEVWEAVQSGTDLPVAIKFLHPVLMMHSTARDRVKKEAKALGRLRRYSRVITLYDYFETDETVALVLEFADGGSLADRIDTQGALPVAEALTIMDGVLQGLQAIHAEGFVHRDIKPDNVLLARDESGTYIPKITDLGIVHAVDGTRLTAHGSQLGTFEYMAPEIFQSQPASVQTDIYACGIMLYELLVSQPPFVGDQAAVITGHLMNAPDERRLPSEIPAHVRSALNQALSKKPDERFTDCPAFRAALNPSVPAPVEMDSTAFQDAEDPPVESGSDKETVETKSDPVVQASRHVPGSASSNGRSVDPNAPGGLPAAQGIPRMNIRTDEGHTGSVHSVTFSPDGQTVASCSLDKTIRLWNARDGQHLRTLKGHSSSVWSVMFSSDGQTIASGSQDKTIRQWNVSDGRPLRTLKGGKRCQRHFWGDIFGETFFECRRQSERGARDIFGETFFECRRQVRKQVQ